MLVLIPGLCYGRVHGPETLLWQVLSSASSADSMWGQAWLLAAWPGDPVTAWLASVVVARGNVLGWFELSEKLVCAQTSFFSWGRGVFRELQVPKMHPPRRGILSDIALHGNCRSGGSPTLIFAIVSSESLLGDYFVQILLVSEEEEGFCSVK